MQQQGDIFIKHKFNDQVSNKLLYLNSVDPATHERISVNFQTCFYLATSFPLKFCTDILREVIHVGMFVWILPMYSIQNVEINCMRQACLSFARVSIEISVTISFGVASSTEAINFIIYLGESQGPWDHSDVINLYDICKEVYFSNQDGRPVTRATASLSAGVISIEFVQLFGSKLMKNSWVQRLTSSW